MGVEASAAPAPLEPSARTEPVETDVLPTAKAKNAATMAVEASAEDALLGSYARTTEPAGEEVPVEAIVEEELSSVTAISIVPPEKSVAMPWGSVLEPVRSPFFVIFWMTEAVGPVPPVKSKIARVAAPWNPGLEIASVTKA